MKHLFLKKTKNSGFSLVELVVAIGILAVIGTIVAFMMTSSSKNYGRMSVESQLQSEAQLVANAISEYAIDSYDAENKSTVALDASYNNTENKILVLHSLGRDGVAYDYVITKTAENKLYIGERTKAVGATDFGAYSYALLGNYISDFTVDTSHVEKDNIIDFQLEYTKNNRVYRGNYQVLMRNRAYADKTPENVTINDPLKLILSLKPRQVYVDVVAGAAGNYYYIDEITDGKRRSLLQKKIELSAAVSSNRDTTNEVEWYMEGFDGNCFELPESQLDAEGNKQLKEKAYLTIKNGPVFAGSAIDDFTVYIAKSMADTDGNVVSAESKRTKVHLRRVKSIKLRPTSGYTSWRSSYDELGAPSSEAETYAIPNIYGIYQPMVLNATVVQKWVPYGGGLDWTIQMRQKGEPTNTWQDCPASFASLQYAETLTSTVNSVRFGDNAKNGQLYKVTARSKFDNTVFCEYVIGVAPRERELGGGFNSRGFYVNLAEFAEEYAEKMPGLNYGGNSEVLNDFKNGNFSTVIKNSGGGGGGFENSGFKVEKIGNEWYAYLDYESFQYTNSQTINFYSNCGQIEIYITTTPSNGSVTLYYWIAPVYVHKDSPSQNVFVIPRGSSRDVKIKTDYYNIIGEKYFGIYVKNDKNASTKFGPNLAGANHDLNPYLSCKVQSAYGDVKHFVDTMRVSMEAKESLIYNPEPMTVRFTAEDYYKLCNENQKTVSGPINSQHYGYQFYTSPCTDVTVYVANVLDQTLFIPCPATKYNSMYPLTQVNAGERKEINVVKEDGTTARAETYKAGTQYKCDYAGTTYTYNPTYYYWYK